MKTSIIDSVLKTAYWLFSSYLFVIVLIKLWE